MPLTVRGLVSRAELRLELLVEGDLDRVVTWIHSSEMPDPARYLSGGEVVLTAGIWHWAGASAEDFVGGLASGGASAVGFGTTPLRADVPDDLVAACRSRDLTLFHVPDDVAFVAVTAAFVDTYVHDHELPLLDSLARGERLVRALQGEQGWDGLLRVLRRWRPGWCGVIDVHRGLVAGVGKTPAAPVLESLARRADTPGYRTFALPGRGEETLLALQGDAPFTVEERAVVDQVLAFLAIEAYRERAVTERERRFAAELVELIGAGAAQLPAVAARLRSFGLDPAAPLLVVACDGVDAADPADRLATALSARDLRAVAVPTATAVFAVVQVGPEVDPAQLGTALAAGLPGRVSVGISGTAADVEGLAAALVQAREVCRYVTRRGAGGSAVHGALASHSLLLAAQEPAVLGSFVQTLLQPLLEQDARRGTQLVETLERFLGSGGHYRETAEALHIHVNTLRLRLERIDALTGRELARMEDRVDFWLALRARESG